MPSGRHRSQGKGPGKRNDNKFLYSTPLPVLFKDVAPRPISSLLAAVGLALTKIESPDCEGFYDPITRSVWIPNPKDSLILWRRGFFGKGDLSRSEPSWLARQKSKRGKLSTAEEIRERRRAERKQFKLDRAQAIAAVHAEAEAVFANEGRVITPALSGPSIPSAATWKPSPHPSPAQSDPDPDNVEGDEPELEDVEHLQITLPEAFFLAWNFDCLTIWHSLTHELMTIDALWDVFQRTYLQPPIPAAPTLPLRFDNPFLINYMVYHHYRALGWVVRGGLKFCVDYLLYKRGPVFAHAEFALVVCPVYEDPADQEYSQTHLHNVIPFSWIWLSTINRVNTQVQKTLVLVYVTIPAKSRVDSNVLRSPACLAYYTVREVVVRRFIPARMRD